MSKPLVSFCLRSYNQKHYFREALQGAFGQDYSPMEICIYDDCSTDGTDEMIREMVAEYQKNDGKHKIIYVRGEVNIGNIRAAEKMFSMAHGVLCVQNDGDDISVPYRVSRTMAEWEAHGSKAKLIHCGAWKFDGNVIVGDVEPLSALNPRGACAAYSRDVFSAFPPVERADAYDDRPYAFRAALIGDELYIPDKLVLYRVGTGASTNCNTKATIKSLQHTLAGIEQNIIDIQSRDAMLFGGGG